MIRLPPGSSWARRALQGSAAVLGLVVPACSARAAAQSVLERSPNLDVSWVAPPGALQFDFLHRFTVSKAPERKVGNSPTFLLGAGLPGRLMVAFNYATNSDIAARYPNEWEFLGRWQALSADLGAPLDATLQAAYNLASRSADGALGLGRPVGPLRLQLEARVLGNAYASGSTRAALAGGGTLRLGRWLALAGDAGRLLGAGSRKLVWGGGLQLAIPYTPHTLSLQATNTSTGTLQGASRASGTTRYGFAFTIPVTLRRYFGHVAAAPAAGATVSGGPPPDSASAGATSAGAVSSPAAGAAVARDSASAGAAAQAAPVVSAAPSSRTAAAAPAGEAPARRAPAAAPKPSPKPPSASSVRATIRNLAFLPGRLEVAVGGVVTWTNRDAVAHSITADDGSFDSGLIAPGATWKHTFTKAGRWTFHCTPHPFMHGAVVVR